MRMRLLQTCYFAGGYVEIERYIDLPFVPSKGDLIFIEEYDPDSEPLVVRWVEVCVPSGQITLDLEDEGMSSEPLPDGHFKQNDEPFDLAEFVSLHPGFRIVSVHLK